MAKPPVHADLIKQWADGAEIQYKTPSIGTIWQDIKQPTWRSDCDYRVKPEPKPDVILSACVEKTDWLSVRGSTVKVHACNATEVKTQTDTVMFVFDGETGKLKDCQVLAEE